VGVLRIEREVLPFLPPSPPHFREGGALVDWWVAGVSQVLRQRRVTDGACGHAESSFAMRRRL